MNRTVIPKELKSLIDEYKKLVNELQNFYTDENTKKIIIKIKDIEESILNCRTKITKKCNELGIDIKTNEEK